MTELQQETINNDLADLQIFENEDLNLKIRTILNPDGSISLNAEDTAIGFGWIQTQIKRGKQYTSIRWETLNGYCKEFGFPNKLGKDDYIPESLFYRLGMKANNAVAEKFQNWLAMEVIPMIRKTGKYEMKKQETEPVPTDKELYFARAIVIANEMLIEKDATIKEQQCVIEDQQSKIEKQQGRIEDLEETEKDWKTLMDAKGTFSINQLSQFINVGEYHLFEYLRKLKVLFKNENNDNVPYRRHLSSGKFTVIPAVAPNGIVHSQTRVYPEGIPYITKLLRKNGYLA